MPKSQQEKPDSNEFQVMALSPEIQKAIYDAICDYSGVSSKLESALGALLLGKAMGWRVLKIMHSSSTYKEYEKVLGICFQDVCPESTRLSRKSFAYTIALKLKSFWAVATGKKPMKEKLMLGSIEDVEAAVAKMEGKPDVDG